MRNDITLLDGAVETDIWEKAGSRFPTWLYNVKSPEIVEQLHRSYLEAGAQIILANTFGANAVNIRNSGYTVRQIVGSAMRIARKALGGRARIALSIGPLDGLLEPYGDISKETAFQIFDEQIGCGVENGPDLITVLPSRSKLIEQKMGMSCRLAALNAIFSISRSVKVWI